MTPTIINLILSAVLGIATIVLAWTTGVLSRETRRMRELQEAPRISIRVEPSTDKPRLLLLVLRNEGQGVAENVQFIKIEGDPTYYTETVSSPKDWKGPTKLPFSRGVWLNGSLVKPSSSSWDMWTKTHIDGLHRNLGYSMWNTIPSPARRYARRLNGISPCREARL